VKDDIEAKAFVRNPDKPLRVSAVDGHRGTEHQFYFGRMLASRPFTIAQTFLAISLIDPVPSVIKLSPWLRLHDCIVRPGI
jgi:hypothetical protein